MIVKAEDFKGTAAIPNGTVNAPNQDLLGNVVQLQEFIDEFEQEALTMILGFELAKEFMSKFDDDGNLKSGEDPLWAELKDGKDNYRGIVKAVVHYIFFKFISNDEAHYASTGVAKDKAKGMYSRTITHKAITAWNIFHAYAIGQNNRVQIVRKPHAVGIIWSVDDLYISTREFVIRDKSGLFDKKAFINIEKMNEYGF